MTIKNRFRALNPLSGAFQTAGPRPTIGAPAWLNGGERFRSSGFDELYEIVG